ncbi:MAG: type III pantothenate kinase [Firmicutes bacterium]|nr:type III pantothenate kinase [Bacillota bacterium]
MLLAVDIGNTEVVLGLFQGERLARHWRLSADPRRTPDEYGVFVRALFEAAGVDRGEVTAVAIASVVPPLLTVWREACADLFGLFPYVYGEDGDFGIEVRVDMPAREVGSDILCNAVAARRLCGAPAVAVDFGTALTVDAVAADGAYVGSAIAPGIVTAAEALARKAAKLPRIEYAPPARAIGTSTVEAMQSGLILGFAGQVDGLVRRVRAELGAPAAPVVATGPLAPLMAQVCETIDRVEPWLTLFGLAHVAGRRGGAGGRTA